MKRFYLYVVTCIPTGKKYVGITSVSVAHRWSCHCYSAAQGSPGYLHRAIRKYGSDNFKVRVLDTARSWELLQSKEQRAIKKHKTFGKDGYNLTLGGEGPYGMHHSTKTKARLSVSTREQFKNPVRRKRQSAALKSYFADPRARVKVSTKLKKYYTNPKALSQIRLMVKNRVANLDVRSRQVASLKKRLADPAIRARMSAATTRQFADPKARTRQGILISRGHALGKLRRAANTTIH